MALVEIMEATVYKPDVESLWGFHLEAPQIGSYSDVYAIYFAGWVLGRNSPSVAVELVHENAVFRRVPVHFQRPDITTAYPDVPGAGNSGFWAMVSVLGLPSEFELFVRAILQDKTLVPIGVIKGRRRPMRSGYKPSLQPLMLTTYGRTGSNWVTRLLGKNLQIIAYRPFEFEARVSSYWMGTLKSLSEPASYMQPLTVTNIADEHWWLGNKDFSFEGIIPDPQVQQWLGRENAESLTAFCQSRIEEFYNQIAVIQGRTETLYFVEKYFPLHHARMMIWDLYPQAREILLIRDFRDMVCSIFAYNAKRGHLAFGRELAVSDEDFIKMLRIYALNLLKTYKSQLGRVHLLRYEDLILQPIETLTGILNYLNLDSRLVTVEDMFQRSSQEMLGMQQHQTSLDAQRSIGRWRRDLTPELQAVCQEAFGDVLKEFGYDAE